MPFCLACGQFHTTALCTNPKLVDDSRESWRCGSCGTNYPYWVSRCECSVQRAAARSTEFRTAPAPDTEVSQ